MSEMSVSARGDVELKICEQRFTLSLTLAALAEIEAGLGVSGFEALGGALKSIDASRLILILTALLRAGGAEDPETEARRADPGLAARAVAACFKANLQ
jgi:hypothetical protein